MCEGIDNAVWYKIGCPAEDIWIKLIKLLQYIILMEAIRIMVLSVFISF